MGAIAAEAGLVTIAGFVRDLRALPEAAFDDVDGMERFIASRHVDPASLEPFLFWSKQHYTRNLVDDTDLYNLIAICWEPGQGSSIHNHKGQNCWMSAPVGRLIVQNYRVVAEDLGRNYCEIDPTEKFEIYSERPCAVQAQTPVHAVYNPREFGQRAVSLHLYSRPYNSCIVYSLEKNTCGEIKLHYTSRHGIPVCS